MASSDDLKTVLEHIDQRFTKVEARFDQVDQRFAKIEARFDDRFAKVEARFDQVNQRFDLVSARFDLVDARLDRFEVKLREELDATMEQMRAIETNLLTAFHKWASPLEIRERAAEQAIATLTERLGAVEDRLRDIERKSF